MSQQPPDNGDFNRATPTSSRRRPTRRLGITERFRTRRVGEADPQHARRRAASYFVQLFLVLLVLTLLGLAINRNPLRFPWSQAAPSPISGVLTSGTASIDPTAVIQQAPGAAAECPVGATRAQYAIEPEFRQYYADNGGLWTFGHPISAGLAGEQGIQKVQWFERARLELWPNSRVQGSRLGAQYWGAAASVPSELTVNTATQSRQFANGFTVSGDFLNRWNQFGDAKAFEVFGNPISQEFYDAGRRRSVQYFERVRFEFWPGCRPPYDVQLGLLGLELAPRDSAGIRPPLP